MMAVDCRHIGFALAPFTVEVARERLALFAQAIGETDPMLSGTVAPPSFLKAIEGEGNSSRRILEALEVDLKSVLHVEQQFEYGEPVRAGDQITVLRRVLDIHHKRDGALGFIVIESLMNNAAGSLVGRSRQVVMVRQRKSGGAA